jgi:hypothetical protein
MKMYHKDSPDFTQGLPDFTMRRFELHEIHDHPSFPGPLRDLVTDAMQKVWDIGSSHNSILDPLLEAMGHAKTREVLDLCSGGGGPWRKLAAKSLVEKTPKIAVRLSDKYPNRNAFHGGKTAPEVLCYHPSPVDATMIPGHLRGFRTFFSAFHHFDRDTAERILSDAVESGRGVGVFELAERSPRTMLALLLIPPMTWLLTPVVMPFSWRRLFWTYVIPVVPFVLFYDGVVSCLRAYSPEELEELIGPLKRPGYEWKIGKARNGIAPVNYLLGYPVSASE